MSLAERAQHLKTLQPQLVADVALYSAAIRRSAVAPGWGCPCYTSRSEPVMGYDGFPLLGDTPMELGTQRRLGFVFISGEEAVNILRRAGKFYLWEGDFIGEAVVVPPEAR